MRFGYVQGNTAQPTLTAQLSVLKALSFDEKYAFVDCGSAAALTPPPALRQVLFQRPGSGG